MSVVESYYFKESGIYLQGPITLEECKDLCLNNRDKDGYGCNGIIVDELTPGNCWISVDSYYDYYSNYITQCYQIGHYDGNVYNGYVESCVPCGGSFQLQYWNLTEPPGIETNKNVRSRKTNIMKSKSVQYTKLTISSIFNTYS